MVERGFFVCWIIRIVNARVMFTGIAGNKNVSNLNFRIGIVHGLLLGWERNAIHNLTCHIIIIIIIITFLFTQGMPKQLKTGLHWGPACVNIKIDYTEYGNPRGNSLPAPQFRGNQVYKLRRSAQENQFLMTVLSRNACIIAKTLRLSDERFTKFNFERT